MCIYNKFRIVQFLNIVLPTSVSILIFEKRNLLDHAGAGVAPFPQK